MVIISMFTLFAVEDNGQIYPPLRKEYEGSDISFHCNSFGETEWYFRIIPHHEPVDIKPISSANNLILNLIGNGKAGYYLCYGKYQNSDKHFIAVAKLIVYGE